jgi:hypothetical protein
MWSGRFVTIMSPTPMVSGGGGGITYDQLVNYVEEHCVPSGVVTVSGVTYSEMADYVASHSATESGTCLDGAVLTLTFPTTLIESSYFPVVTKTTVSGVVISVESGCDGVTSSGFLNTRVKTIDGGDFDTDFIIIDSNGL